MYMKAEVLSHWEQLLAYLPSDLEASAKEQGAFLRKRGVPNATTLLRLLLVYSGTALSFRQTVAWAEAQEIATLTDVSLIERMERSEKWLLHLIQQMLPEKAPILSNKPEQICLVDATTVVAPNQDEWRLHLAYDASKESIQQLFLSDNHVAESFKTLGDRVNQNYLYIGDRAYGTQGGLSVLLEQHAQVICRVKGRPYFAHAKANETVTLVVPNGRVFIVPIPEDKQTQVEKRLNRKASKRQSKLRADTIESNLYWFLFCSDEQLSAAEVVGLYRWRWQIELLFKRLKSLQGLDDMLVKSPILCRVYLLCHGLIALMSEKIYQTLQASFPPESIRAAVSLASLAIPIYMHPRNLSTLEQSQCA
jgi:Transposase DDE domain